MGDRRPHTRKYLTKLSRMGETSAREIKRALILIRANLGLTKRETAEGPMIGDTTLWRVRVRFAAEGLESTLS